MSTLENGSASKESVDMIELDMLKQRATLMGIAFSNNIGADTLRERIAAKQEGLPQPEEKTSLVKEKNPLETESLDKKTVKRKTLRQHLRDEQMRLIRIRVTCMDPKKKDLPGEIFTVANEHLGTVKKYVPFGELTENGYHVPYCIYRLMKARKFLNIRTVKDRRTNSERVETNWAIEFALEILEPLTPAQIQDLKVAQISAGSVD